ncbi:hypothetical protein, partial [Oxalobacter paraformigenes]|uniref:hypothetical protein n=1 Tax=Oxalobacter paraformigenes TaxID=556268 RepID=UPI001C9D2AFB
FKHKNRTSLLWLVLFFPVKDKLCLAKRSLAFLLQIFTPLNHVIHLHILQRALQIDQHHTGILAGFFGVFNGEGYFENDKVSRSLTQT